MVPAKGHVHQWYYAIGECGEGVAPPKLLFCMPSYALLWELRADTRQHKKKALFSRVPCAT
jgi:hypothetical protein